LLIELIKKIEKQDLKKVLYQKLKDIILEEETIKPKPYYLKNILSNQLKK
jgi:hypothetical protein